MSYLSIALIFAQSSLDSLTHAQVAEAVSTKTSMSLFEMAMKGGWIMLVLLGLLFLCIYFLVERISVIRKSKKEGPLFMDKVVDYITSGDVKSAVNYCQLTNTPVSRMIQKGISRLGHPSRDILAVIENVGNMEVARLERHLNVVATIAAGAPMIGFLGTVTGMVRAFYEMSNAGNNINIKVLSGGIYEAMITTVAGLIVGIIAMFAYNYLVSRVDSVVNAMEAKTMTFMDMLNDMKEVDNQCTK